MVVIRLARGGAKKAPYYHIVAADQRRSRDGRYIERLGYYNPSARGQDTTLELNKERVDYWLGQGAQPSDRVAYLVKAYNKQDENVLKAAAAKADEKKAQQEVSLASIKKKLAMEKKAEEEAAAAAKEAEAKTEASADEPTKEEKTEDAPADNADK